MIEYECIIRAQQRIVEAWGEQGKRVIEACHWATPFNDSFDEFIPICTPCGGNWAGLLLSGISELWPGVFDAIPENMGSRAFFVLLDVLKLCGVEIEEEYE